MLSISYYDRGNGRSNGTRITQLLHRSSGIQWLKLSSREWKPREIEPKQAREELKQAEIGLNRRVAASGGVQPEFCGVFLRGAVAQSNEEQ